MTPFNFPPPPPPPPKATSTESQEPYASQRGRPNNPRGGRGRGWQGRGRGNSQRGSGSGGNQYAHYSGATARGGRQQQNRQFAQTQLQPQAPAVSSPSTFQSRSDGGNTYIPYNHSANPPPIPSPQANNKRKRGDHIPYQKFPDGSTAGQTSPQNVRPQRVKVASAPAIPSFGFSLPGLAPPAPLPADAKQMGEKKRKKVQLGLSGKEVEVEDTQSLVEEEKKEEEEFDEEAELASKMGVQGMAFEHNGVQISLQTPAEIAAWIKDRRKEYPTRQRVAEKAREAAERRAKELEFLHRLQGKKRAKEEPDNPSVASSSAPARLRAVRETKLSSLDELHDKVKESSLREEKPPDAAKTTTVDLGLGYASDSASESGYSILDEESSVVSSSSEESDEGSDDDDSDSGPETQSSKVEVPPIVVPPAVPALAANPATTSPQLAPDGEKKDDRRICSSWKNNGSCRYGKHCRYAHPPKMTEKRKGLYERLIEQEKDKADRLALDTIKWLGRNGFLG